MDEKERSGVESRDSIDFEILGTSDKRSDAAAKKRFIVAIKKKENQTVSTYIREKEIFRFGRS